MRPADGLCSLSRVACAPMTKVGGDPERSVVGPAGEAHRVDGLYIGDSSILSNGIGGPNPTLTLQALATRTAKQIMTRLP